MGQKVDDDDEDDSEVAITKHGLFAGTQGFRKLCNMAGYFTNEMIMLKIQILNE